MCAATSDVGNKNKNLIDDDASRIGQVGEDSHRSRKCESFSFNVLLFRHNAPFWGVLLHKNNGGGSSWP